MSRKTFRLYQRIMTVIVAMLVAWAVLTGNALIPIPVVIVGVVILFLLKKRVKEVVVDERVYSIAGRASRLTFITFTILAVIVGATLISLSRDGSPDLFPIGLTLVYSVCSLLCLYWIAHIYYSRKLGGRE